ncbi:signal-regulatory protein beta-1-like [Protobothrops mucrosquamatus]|uniref:signal-regulatory protein beta-1-like n=1 Tax=Protobothrops mucrosquamatus TaxID=103944 RepID=UPI0010FAE80C|nr:signal-regulatory protein beta-1-like [Protobothrops mucrosquamatus]
MAALRSFKRIPGPLQLLLFLLLLPQDLVVTGQKTEVTQLPETISVNAGDSLTLKCTLIGANLPGGVRWFKGLDRNQPPIYSDKQGISNRGVRLVPGSNTEFSINIPNIRPEDAGTYYCVKFRAGFPERELASGKGTQVFVIAMPSQPVVHGPTRRVAAGSRATFNCSTEGFSPPEITVSWLKDGKEIQAAQTNILNLDGTESISYRAESTVEIPLEQGDVRSQLTCQIQHRSLEAPLQQSFPLGDVLRVPPKVHMETSPPPPIQLNTTVTVTCSVEEFYPDDANLELFFNNAPNRKGTVGLRTPNPDETFSLNTYLEVVATEDRNNSQFSCVVQQESQSLLTLTTKLAVVMQPEDHKCLGSAPSSVPQQSLLVLWLPLFLSKAAVFLLVSCLFLTKMCRGKKAKSRSRKPQEVKGSESPIRNAYS